MVWLAALGGASFLLVCVVGGTRLLLLARRTRGLPETVLGGGLLVLGGFVTPLAALSRAETGLDPGVRGMFLALHLVLMALGMGGFAWFTQRVFRPDARWARALATGLPAAMLLCVPIVAIERGFAAAASGPGPGGVAHQVLSLAVLIRTAFEALRYALLLRRRLSLGLADAAVAQRVLLWGSGVGLATSMSAVTIAGELQGANPLTSVAGAAMMGAAGFAASSCIYVAFFPPRAYVRWVHSRRAGARAQERP
jgi:hypothetical protein